MDNLHYLECFVAGDPQRLAEVSFKCGAVSEECKESLDELDSCINSGTTARYLLTLVYRRFHADSTAYENVLKILSESFYTDLPLIREGRPNSDSFTIEGTILTENDISCLTEILHDVAPEWDKLGVFLKLSRVVLRNCESSDCVRSLSNILHAWISSSKEPCKLKMLIQALDSRTVGHSNAAKSLRQNYMDKMRSMLENSRKSDTAQSSYFKHCSSDLKIAEGKSVLIEADYVSCEEISFQWTKDGEKLTENYNYHHVRDSILMITDTDLAQVGQYQCLILDSSENIIARSHHIEIKVTLSPEREYLMSLYSSEFEPNDTWPPFSTTKFINLALVNSYGICNASYRHTIRGDTDDIIKNKSNIDYKKVFHRLNEGRLVLVEGRPGSGKTTLARKVCKDWAKDGSVLMGFRMVFFIYLRLLTEKDKNLEDILGRLFYSDSSQRNELNFVVNKLAASKGKKSCFILDGLDEYDLSNRKGMFIYNLIYKKFLQDATVVVFSRPVATHDIRSSNRMNTRVEVLGFSTSQIRKFIIHYPFTDTSTDGFAKVHSNLLIYLQTHSNVMHMCYLPVHVAMICFLYKKLGDNIPNTESKIYEMFTILTIIRHQNKESGESELDIESLWDLEGDLLNKFKALCKNAFEKTVSAKQILDGSDIRSDAHTLGLVTLDKTVGIYKMKTVHTFHHLTFQEYLAAWHVALLMKQNQLETIHLHASNPHMKNAWKYYCGIINFDGKIEQFRTIIESHNSDTIYTLQCAFESQQEGACVLSIKNQTEPYLLNFVDHIFSPYDMSALEYVLVAASSEKIHLKFEKCTFEANFEADSLQAVSSFFIIGHYKEAKTDLTFLKKMINLVELDIRVDFNMLDLEAITLPLLKIIRFTLFSNSNYLLSQEKMKLLQFNSSVIEEVSAFSLQDFPGEEEEAQFYDRMRRMQVVRSELCPIFGFSAVFRGDLPKISIYNYKIKNFCGIEEAHYQKCIHLTLINCGIDTTLAEALAEELKYCYNLAVLKLDFNNIGDAGAFALAVYLKSLEKLTHFSANYNQISDVGALKLVDSLTHCSAFNYLDLQGNLLSLQALKEILVITKEKSPKLKIKIWNKKLNFAEKNNAFENFTENVLNLSGICLSFIMNRIPDLVGENLQVLNLSCTSLYMCDFSTLVSHLSCCKHLKSINLSRNCFYWKDPKEETFLAEIMKELFKNCPLIEFLDMSHNDLDIDSLEMMGLRTLKNLCHLDLSSNPAIFNFYDQIPEIGECRNLCTLLINDCELDYISLASILRKCQKISKISLTCYKELREKYASLIFLLASSQLKDLSICQNGWTELNIIPPAAMFDVELHLERLSITSYQINEETFAILCSFHWRCLHTLDVSWNSIGSANLSALTFALKFCFTRLHTLNIRSNKIGNNAMVTLQESLEGCEASLLSLDIGRNELGDEGIEILMKVCTKLNCLDVSYNKLTAYGIQILTENSFKYKDLHLEEQRCDQ